MNMSGVAARSFVPSQQCLLLTHQISQFLKGSGQFQFTKKQQLSKQKRLMVKTHMTSNTATYTSTTYTDIPFSEAHGASFDEYFEDEARVFAAIFHKRSSRQLNEEECRIEMLPIQLVFLTVRPVIDMRLRFKSNGKEYPLEVPSGIRKVLELDLIRWELQGLDSNNEQSHFDLGVRSSLYPDRRGAEIRLKGHLEVTISFYRPPLLAIIPDNVHRGAIETVLSKVMQNMNCELSSSLLADYSEFKRERERDRLYNSI